MGTIVVLLVVVAVAAAAAAARVQGGDQRSIARHHEALSKLGDVAARGGGAVALSASPAPRPRPAPVVATASLAAPRRRRRVLRRVLAALGGVVIVAWLAVLVAHGAEAGRHEAAVATASGASTTALPTTPTTAPTTAPPAPPEVTPSAVDERGAVFTTGPSVSVLLVAARGRCWVGVSGNGDSEDFQATMETGDRQRIDGAAPIEVRLGNPTAVDVLVDGVAADIPAPEGHPFDLTFTTA